MKKIVAMLLAILFCICLCSCGNKKSGKQQTEIEFAASIQEDIIEALKDYCDEDISREKLRDTLFSINGDVDESSVYWFCTLVRNLDFHFSEEDSEYLKKQEEFMYYREFENTDDNEVKMAAQAREDIAAVYTKFWNKEINGDRASAEVSSIIEAWREKSNVVSFYWVVNDLFYDYDFGVDIYGEDDAREYIERLNAYDFD